VLHHQPSITTYKAALSKTTPDFSAILTKSRQTAAADLLFQVTPPHLNAPRHNSRGGRQPGHFASALTPVAGRPLLLPGQKVPQRQPRTTARGREEAREKPLVQQPAAPPQLPLLPELRGHSQKMVQSELCVQEPTLRLPITGQRSFLDLSSRRERRNKIILLASPSVWAITCIACVRS